MKNKMILVFLLTVFNVYSSVPTTESLFRNNNNSDVQATLVMVTLQAEKDVNKNTLEKMSSEESSIEDEAILTSEKKAEKVNLKYLFTVNDNGQVEAVRVTYRTGKMDDENIIDVKFYKNLTTDVLNATEHKGLLLSLLSSLALNRSEEMSAFLKKVSKNYKTNQDLIDPEKKALYSKYKNYLKLVKEDESLKESLENPMDPKDEDIKKTVEMIKERPFLQKDESVTLEKKESHFLWKVDLDVIDATFDGKTQRLLRLDYTEPQNKLSVSLDDYILFNGSNELPKIIKLDTQDHTYTLRTSSHVQLNLGTKSMWNRFNEYKDKLKENGEVKLFDFFFL